MPLYDYECTDCGEVFEARQSMHEDTEKPKCPKCKSGNTKKVFSPFNQCPTGGSRCPPRRFG